jgi:betaine-aldehyde dehydrogenase
MEWPDHEEKNMSALGTVRSRWSSTDEARRFDVINPATGGVLAQVYGAGTAEVDQAVKVAAEAQHSWARRTPAERGAVLRRASLAIADRMQELAELESSEMGKPVSQALGFDLLAAVGLFDFFGGLVHAVTGDVRNQGPTMDVTEHHPPIEHCRSGLLVAPFQHRRPGASMA